MRPYCISTTVDDDPSLAFSTTVMAPSEEAAIQKVLLYLQLEFDVPPDAPYHYRAS